MKYTHCPLCQEILVTSTIIKEDLDCPSNSFRKTIYDDMIGLTHFYFSEPRNEVGIQLTDYDIFIDLEENITHITKVNGQSLIKIKKIINLNSEEDILEQIKFYLLYS
jgi:hypothetical protein